MFDPILLPTAVAGLAAWAFFKKKKPRGVMSPEQKMIYKTALEELKEPEKLLALADAFEKEGFTEQAELLRKRAAIRSQPDDVKAAHKAAFRKGMASVNPLAARNLAKAFHSMGAVGSAAALNNYASGLETAQGKSPYSVNATGQIMMPAPTIPTASAQGNVQGGVSASAGGSFTTGGPSGALPGAGEANIEFSTSGVGAGLVTGAPVSST